jgi:hypothetical protein
MKTSSTLSACLFAYLSASAAVADVSVTSGGLEGKWVLGDKQDCGSGSADYVIMHENGIIEMGQGAAAKAVGFWKLNNDRIILHMLLSPEASGGENPFYRNSYNYQHRSVKVIEAKPDVLEIIVGADIDAGVQTLTRCP